MNINDIDKVIEAITAAQGIKITGVNEKGVSFIKVEPDRTLLIKAKHNSDMKKILNLMKQGGLKI